VRYHLNDTFYSTKIGNTNESQISYKELKNQRGIIRTGHALIAFEHYVIAIGNTQPFKGCIEYLDTRTNTLESVDIGSHISFRYGHTACLYDYDKIILFGGKLCAGTNPAEGEQDGDAPEEPVQGGFGQGGFGVRPAGFGARNDRLEKTTVLSDVVVLKIKEDAGFCPLFVYVFSNFFRFAPVYSWNVEHYQCSQEDWAFCSHL